MSDEKPNILWICTDQQRYDTIASLGNELINTPNIDRLVNGGVAFTRAYVQSPVCSPSRASFLTGRYPRTTRCRQNGQDIPPTERLVTRILADHGYTCGLSGKLHLGSCENGRVEPRIDDGYDAFYWSHHPQPDWKENAYTQWLEFKGQVWEKLYAGPGDGYVKEGVPTEYHQTTWCANMAIDFIKEQNEAGPWCYTFNCFDPHHPFDPPPEYMKRYNPDDMPLPKYRKGELDDKPIFQRRDHKSAHNESGEFPFDKMTDENKQSITAAYYAMIELIDDSVGRMLAALEKTGQLDNTIVIFMSDHGEMLGDHGFYLKGPHFYEQAVRVPLIFSWPGHFKEDLKADALVELVDIAPTLLEAAGIDPPEGMQGKSLSGMLTGKERPDNHRDSILCEYYNSWQHKDAYGTMLRTKDKKICVYHSPGNPEIEEPGELYDLSMDPEEFTNLWNNPGYAEVKCEMMRKAFDRSVLTMDPLPVRLGEF